MGEGDLGEARKIRLEEDQAGVKGFERTWEDEGRFSCIPEMLHSTPPTFLPPPSPTQGTPSDFRQCLC